jgi:hypothetical protein
MPGLATRLTHNAGIARVATRAIPAFIGSRGASASHTRNTDNSHHVSNKEWHSTRPDSLGPVTGVVPEMLLLVSEPVKLTGGGVRRCRAARRDCTVVYPGGSCDITQNRPPVWSTLTASSTCCAAAAAAAASTAGNTATGDTATGDAGSGLRVATAACPAA